MASGKYSALFPSSESGSDNHVEKKGSQTVLAKGFFSFGETTGIENLLLGFPKELIPELEKAIVEAAIGEILNLADTDSLSRDSARQNLPPRIWSSMMMMMRMMVKS